jgi:hypothetical protein
MASIDYTNAALYTLLHASGALLALAPGDVWDTHVEDNAAFPYCVFQRVTGVPDYTFGLTLSSDKQVYMFKAYARDTTTKTGRELAAQIVDLAKGLLLNAALSITGSVTLACYPTHDIPPLDEPHAAEVSLDTFQEGFYFDIYAA